MIVVRIVSAIYLVVLIASIIMLKSIPKEITNEFSLSEEGIKHRKAFNGVIVGLSALFGIYSVFWAFAMFGWLVLFMGNGGGILVTIALFMLSSYAEITKFVATTVGLTLLVSIAFIPFIILNFIKYSKLKKNK